MWVFFFYAKEFFPGAIFGELREQNYQWYPVKAENAIENKYLSIR